MICSKVGLRLNYIIKSCIMIGRVLAPHMHGLQLLFLVCSPFTLLLWLVCTSYHLRNLLETCAWLGQDALLFVEHLLLIVMMSHRRRIRLIFHWGWWDSILVRDLCSWVGSMMHLIADVLRCRNYGPRHLCCVIIVLFVHISCMALVFSIK